MTWGVLQDVDPTQNSIKATGTFLSIGTTIFSIPPWSPRSDLNPIENLFNLIQRSLAEEADKK